ncbi:replication-relaxation family protein [Yinghuangia sp. ASG 101]|uniref:replication-relaxation family protein n=1 Tax=Yinghuangia sp. ASG 101 TaxID=2896848 RepID=UPI001E3DE92E|nr:replication-relaxation family protein [Yinghuangia sp. ASG 101]UGQ10539.1 replication-relaxation family protein [Yinghuangia sp. ASG 101]
MISKNAPQNALRGPIAARPTTPAATGADHLAYLARRLTPRDRWLTRMLNEHRVFTTRQITELAWNTPRVANMRLLDLYRWRILDRFQPRRSKGTTQMHYVLDVAGATVLAYEDDLDPKRVAFNRNNTVGVAHSLRLAHTLGVNGFFTPMVQRSRQPDSTARLTAWWSETRCAEHFGDTVRPDAYGRWREHGTEIEWFLEHDTGSERPAQRLGTKLLGYARLAISTGITTPVLIWTPTITREATVRRALAEVVPHLADPALVPIATASIEQAVMDDATDPSRAAWLPLARRSLGRRPLADLPEAWPHLPVPHTTPPEKTDTQGKSRPDASTARVAPPDPVPPPPAQFGAPK